MSDKEWDGSLDRDDNRGSPRQAADGTEDEEFGEFEGFEGASQFESNMAQPLPRELQAGLSCWANFPDYVPSQRTTTSALQPDLLPLRAGVRPCPLTNGTSSRSSSGFDLPDVSPHESSGNASQAEAVTNACSSSTPPCNGFTVATITSLPDVSSQKDIGHRGKTSLPDVRANIMGAIPKMKHQGADGEFHVEDPTRGVADLQLSNTGTISIQEFPQHLGRCHQPAADNVSLQHLDRLQQRVGILEEQLTQLQNREQQEKSAREIARTRQEETLEEFRQQVLKLEQVLGRSNSCITEERLKTCLQSNSEVQAAALEERMSTITTVLTERLEKMLQPFIKVNDGAEKNSSHDLQEVLQKFAQEQAKREVEMRTSLLNCLEAIFANSQQQLRAILQRPPPSEDS